MTELPQPDWQTDDGSIRLYCCDCRDLLAKMPSGCVAIADPPYGINLEEHGRNGYDWKIAGDDTRDVGIEFIEAWKPKPLLVFAPPKAPWPGKWRQHLVWDKGPAVGGGGDRNTCWKFDWELIQTANVKQLYGKRDSSVLRFWVGQRDYHYHPAQKPISLLSYLIRKTTSHDDIVIDPFAGSASLALACRRLKRRYIGIELEEKYFTIAVDRIEKELNRHPLFKEPTKVQQELFA